MAGSKERQISVRVSAETDRWLDKQAGGSRRKARFIRELIDRERARQRQQELLGIFNRAAAELTHEDLEDRELVVGSFAGGDAVT
jgi:hypothetical protein